METYFTVSAILGCFFIVCAIFKGVFGDDNSREPKDIREARRRYEMEELKYKLQGRDYAAERRQQAVDNVKKRVDEALEELYKKYPNMAKLDEESKASPESET